MVFLDEDEDGAYDNGEAFTFSSADGTYEFAGLDADRSYAVSQILHFGWSSTYAGPSATPSGGPSPPIAAIVNSRYVLTAAHCVFEMPADEIEILIGSADLNSGGERVNVQAVRSARERNGWEEGSVSATAAVLSWFRTVSPGWRSASRAFW